MESIITISKDIDGEQLGLLDLNGLELDAMVENISGMLLNEQFLLIV
jgi:hypothetical protein